MVVVGRVLRAKLRERRLMTWDGDRGACSELFILMQSMMQVFGLGTNIRYLVCLIINTTCTKSLQGLW